LPDWQARYLGSDDSITPALWREARSFAAAALFHRLANRASDTVRSSSTSSLKKLTIVTLSISNPSLKPAVIHHASFCARRTVCVATGLTLHRSTSFRRLSSVTMTSFNAEVNQWDDYRRRTGDAKSTVSDLAAAQVDLQASYDLFLEQKDYAAASLSTFKIATIQRLLNQHRQAIHTYQSAIELAKLGHRTDYQTIALSNLSYSELRVGDSDAAEQHAREAVRLGTN